MTLSLADYNCFACADYQPDKDRGGESAVVEKESNGTRLLKNQAGMELHEAQLCCQEYCKSRSSNSTLFLMQP